MNLSEIRQKYPQYGDLSDEQIAKGLHGKYYSDLPFEDFSKRIGYGTPAPTPPPPPEPTLADRGKAVVSGVAGAAKTVAGAIPSMPDMRPSPESVEQANQISPVPQQGGVIDKAIGQTIHGALVGELPEGIGALQKPVEAMGKYSFPAITESTLKIMAGRPADVTPKDFDGMTVADENAYRARYPNIMAARHALASLLPVGDKLASPEARAEFAKLPVELQRLEILGETAGWALGPGAAKLAGAGVGKLIRKIPWFEKNWNKPIGDFLRESDWFRMATNKERGLAVQQIDDMQRAGMSEAEILRSLKSQGRDSEFAAFKDAAIKRRAQGEVPVEAKTEQPITPEPAIEPATEAPLATVEKVRGKKPLSPEPPIEMGAPVEAPVKVYRGTQKGDARTEGVWFTPDKKAAEEYSGLWEGGEITESEINPKHFAKPDDVRKAAESTGHDISNNSTYELLHHTTFEGAEATVEKLREQGFNGVHLTKGEDFSPDGDAIESYMVFKEPKAASLEVLPDAPKTITTNHPVYGKQELDILEEYKGEYIAHTGEDNIVVVSKDGSKVFFPALDDGGQKKWVDSANNAATARKYIDWLRKTEEERKAKPAPAPQAKATEPWEMDNDELAEFTENKASEYGGKNKWFASDEYKSIYPKLKEKWDADISNHANDGKKAVSDEGLKDGDLVETVGVGISGAEAPVVGKLYFDKNGVPKVRITDSGYGGKKNVAWHRGWKKIAKQTAAKPQTPKTPAQAASDQRGSTISEGLVGEVGVTVGEKAKAPKKSGVRTLRGRIKQSGGINFGNFKGELKEMPTAVKFLSRKAGVEIDVLEAELKQEGWLADNESLLDMLSHPVKHKDFLRRDKIGSVAEKPEAELSESEKRFLREQEVEPEWDANTEFETVTAYDIPEGKEITAIDPKTGELDRFKVKSKDPFSVTLEDGTLIELSRDEEIDIVKERPTLELKREKAGRVKPAMEGTAVSKKSQEGLGLAVPPQKTAGGELQQEIFRTPTARDNLSTAEQSLRPKVAETAGAEAERGSIQFGTATKDSFSFADPNVEVRYRRGKDVAGPNVWEKMKERGASLKRKMTREFEHLPNTAEFAQLKFDLRKLAKQRGVSGERAVQALRGITVDLDPKGYDLFSRKVFLDDLADMVKRGEKELPQGFTPESVVSESQRIKPYIESSPSVAKALAERKKFWNALKTSYTDSMGEIGFKVEDRLKRQDYFRHIVLDYVKASRALGVGSKLKTPTGRGFLQKRQGSTSDIVTDYIHAEHEVMAQMIHDVEVAKTIKAIRDTYDIYDKLVKKAKEEGVKWQELIPEGYATWQAREGNVFYFADSIPARIAEALAESEFGEIGITADDLKQVMAVGGKRKQFVIPEAIAETLDNLSRKTSYNPLVKLHKAAIRKWKQWQLVSPRRFFKYNMRNVTGDAEAMFVGNHHAFLKVPRATADLYAYFVSKKPMAPELQDWFEMGGIESTLQAQEMGELKKLKVFSNLGQGKGELVKAPVAAWKGYWKTVRMSTDFREAMLRYAAYLDYLESIQKTGKPRNYGASLPVEVNAIVDPKEKAFMLSNDLLGAYDRITTMGQSIRESMIPFWSWQEVNAKRYYRLFNNAASDRNFASAVGRKVLGKAAKSPYIAYRLGKFFIKATGLWMMVQAYNNFVFPEEEKSLPENIRTRPHIIIGRNADGTVNHFSRIGMLGDMLEWVGLDAAPKLVNDFMDGRKNLVDVATEMAKSPVNKFAQGALPFTKLAGELVTRRGLFPDVFAPRTIRDRAEYLAKNFGLEHEYRAVAGKPSKPYTESIPGFFYYTSDPLQAAYSDTLAEIRQFMKKRGKFGDVFYLTPTGDALYNLRLAVRMGDKEAAQRYYKKYATLYVEQGKDPKNIDKNIERSFQRMHPLSTWIKKDGIDKEGIEFVASLDDEGKERLAMAVAYYYQLASGETFKK